MITLHYPPSSAPYSKSVTAGQPAAKDADPRSCFDTIMAQIDGSMVAATDLPPHVSTLVPLVSNIVLPSIGDSTSAALAQPPMQRHAHHGHPRTNMRSTSQFLILAGSDTAEKDDAIADTTRSVPSPDADAPLRPTASLNSDDCANQFYPAAMGASDFTPTIASQPTVHLDLVAPSPEPVEGSELFLCAPPTAYDTLQLPKLETLFPSQPTVSPPFPVFKSDVELADQAKWEPVATALTDLPQIPHETAKLVPYLRAALAFDPATSNEVIIPDQASVIAPAQAAIVPVQIQNLQPLAPALPPDSQTVSAEMLLPLRVTNLAQTFGSDQTTPHIKANSAHAFESKDSRLLDSFQHVETTRAIADPTATIANLSHAWPSAPLQTPFAAGIHAGSAHALPKTISSAAARAATDPDHHNIELTLAPLTTISIHRNASPSPMLQTAFVSDAHTASTHALPRTISTAVVKTASGPDHDNVELTLDPIELGRVRFALITTGHQLQVTLSVERPETLDLLRRHADDLRAEFRAAGLDAASLSFGHWGQNKSDDEPQTATESTEPAAVSPPQAAPRMRAASTGLDLRL